jgi:hypothetical protein
MWAMVLSSLAPVVAQAMVAATGKLQWVEVCSASGIITLKAVAADAQDVESDQGSPAPGMANHCPWCVFHGSAAAPPLSNLSVPAPAAMVQTEPVFSGKPFVSHVWADAQARAPPFAS